MATGYVLVMPETLIAVIGSLIGVLLGGVLSYFFAKRTQVSKALHEARIVAFARFAAAVMEYRRSLMERWFVELGAQAQATSADDVYQARSAAWGAMFEVQLLAGRSAIGDLARTAVDVTSEIKNAVDRSALAAQADASRESVQAFINAARAEVAASIQVL
jgi:hypothetical protein